MQEGWLGDDYLIIFEKSEEISASVRYDLSSALPGFTIIGLQGWDDFIIRDIEGRLFTVPTVPLNAKYLAPVKILLDKIALQPDPRFGTYLLDSSKVKYGR